jgi:hypothetical protein
MIEILRDSIWQFLGFIGTIASMATAYYIYKKQQSVKSLAYHVSGASIAAPNLSVGNRVKVLVDDHLTVNPYVINIKVINNGTVPIPSEDYESPLELYFGETATIISVDISEASPYDIIKHLNPIIEGDSVRFSKFLLNAGDSISVTLLVDQPGDVELTGRIIGVRHIYRFISYPNPERLALVSALFWLSLALSLFIAIRLFIPEMYTLIAPSYSLDLVRGIAIGCGVTILSGWLTLFFNQWIRVRNTFNKQPVEPYSVLSRDRIGNKVP